MAAKKPDETPIAVETAEPAAVVAPAEPEPIKVPRGAVVRSLIHLDDSANTGNYYRPGDVIEGWDDDTIARMVASNIVEIVEP